MAQPYIGEIRIFAAPFAPPGWELCNGQLLQISDEPLLFQLIGRTYGGDGQSTFALPDLRGRAPLHQGTREGNSYVMAETGGIEEVMLTVTQIPGHNHVLLASTNAADAASPIYNVLANSGTMNLYAPEPPSLSLSPDSITSEGGSQPHSNMQPYVAMNFIIATFGIFPTSSSSSSS